MRSSRTASALHPNVFGRGPVRTFAETVPASPAIGAELKLFATTFAAGFLFVSVLIA